MLLVSLFASTRLFQWRLAVAGRSTFEVLGMQVPTAAIWGAVLFVILGGLAFLFTFGVPTGLKAIDGRAQRLIDLLIDTEAELAKVSWPSPEELTSSTTAVLISILLIGAFLFCVDWLVAVVLRGLRVLPV